MIKTFMMITRAYALPMSVFSWLAAFAFGISQKGNILYGLIALFGICFAHLGANMLDDYIDYKILKKINENGKTVLINAQRGKCEYVLNGTITPRQLLIFAFLFFLSAIGIGIFFTIKTGLGALVIMILSGLAGLIYPIAGKFRLCELLIGLIYGPFLYGGVCYVMTGAYDWKTLIVCIPTMILTVNLLYTDTMLDYTLDKSEGKKTIANSFSHRDGLIVQAVLLAFVYISLIPVYLKTGEEWVFLALITIPLAVNLIKSVKLFIEDKTKLPDRKFYEGPMENWDIIMKEGSAGFMMRMYQARNLMIFFSIIYAAALGLRS